MTTLRWVFFWLFILFLWISPRLNDFHGLYAKSNIRRCGYSPRCFCALSTYVTGACNGDVSSHETTLFGSAAVVLSSSVVFVFGIQDVKCLRNLLEHLFQEKKKKGENMNILEIFQKLIKTENAFVLFFWHLNKVKQPNSPVMSLFYTRFWTGSPSSLKIAQHKIQPLKPNFFVQELKLTDDNNFSP